MRTNSVRYFRTLFLEEARAFLRTVSPKAAEKIIRNIRVAEQTNDPRLFKKLKGELWEFRSKYQNLQFRLIAFWDKNGPVDTLVVVTHGIIKKTDKLPEKEMDKAEQVRKQYFQQKNK